jgi:hypothetical protein
VYRKGLEEMGVEEGKSTRTESYKTKGVRVDFKHILI